MCYYKQKEVGMAKRRSSIKDLVGKVEKRKKEVRLRQQERDTPIPYARVHETEKNNPKAERKEGKRIAKKALRDYE